MKRMKKLIVILVVAVIAVALTTCSHKETVEPYRYGVFDTDPVIDSASLVPDEPAKPDSMIHTLPLEGKYIYLTIDDGPLNGSKYLDSLIKAEQVKTCLFLVGSHIEGSVSFNKYYKRFQENPYAEVYNHSYSHANHRYAQYYKDSVAVFNDFETNRLDFDMPLKIARLPGRNLWSVDGKTKNSKQSGGSSATLLAENGYKVFGWDVEWEYDHKDYTPKQTVDELVGQIDSMYNSSRTFTRNHVVILMHDQMFAKKNEKNDLGDLIRKLKAEGYSFEFLTSYPR